MTACQTCARRRVDLTQREREFARAARHAVQHDSATNLGVLAAARANRDEAREVYSSHIAECVAVSS